MTQKLSVNVAIIGAGTAGLTARRAAKKAGASVLMIDAGPLGTTCARVGCMPSKLLIAAADAAHHVRSAPKFGVHPGNLTIDGPAVLRRVQEERDRFVGFVHGALDSARESGELLDGRAKIEGEGRLSVFDDEGKKICDVIYEKLVLANGSSPFVPPPFVELEGALLTNENIFELSDLPESLLVVGLGVIGLELGQAFHRLGVRTTLLGVGGGVGALRDPAVLAEAKKVLSEELDMHPEYELSSIESTDDGVRIRFTDSLGKVRDEVFDKVLMAAGRRQRMRGLGLETLGLPQNARSYSIDPDTLQLADLPVFVAGDANDLHPLLHEAADDGYLAGENAARYPAIRAATRRVPISVIFSDPQIAIVGTGYWGLKDAQAGVGEVDFEAQGRARVQGLNRGKLRIYADRKTGHLLGAEIFGPRAEHLAHLLSWAVQQGLTVDTALEMPFYHPVLEEGVRTALRDLNANLRHGEPIRCRVSELGPGS